MNRAELKDLESQYNQELISEDEFRNELHCEVNRLHPEIEDYEIDNMILTQLKSLAVEEILVQSFDSKYSLERGHQDTFQEIGAGKPDTNGSDGEGTGVEKKSMSVSECDQQALEESSTRKEEIETSGSQDSNEREADSSLDGQEQGSSTQNDGDSKSKSQESGNAQKDSGDQSGENKSNSKDNGDHKSQNQENQGHNQSKSDEGNKDKSQSQDKNQKNQSQQQKNDKSKSKSKCGGGQAWMTYQIVPGWCLGLVDDNVEEESSND